jgi:hypothetical protein
VTRDVVVVIGAGGIGLAMARRQGAGKSLLLADFNEATLESASNELRGLGHESMSRHPNLFGRSWATQGARRDRVPSGHRPVNVHDGLTAEDPAALVRPRGPLRLPELALGNRAQGWIPARRAYRCRAGAVTTVRLRD